MDGRFEIHTTDIWDGMKYSYCALATGLELYILNIAIGKLEGDYVNKQTILVHPVVKHSMLYI